MVSFLQHVPVVITLVCRRCHGEWSAIIPPKEDANRQECPFCHKRDAEARPWDPRE